MSAQSFKFVGDLVFLPVQSISYRKEKYIHVHKCDFDAKIIFGYSFIYVFTWYFRLEEKNVLIELYSVIYISTNN